MVTDGEYAYRGEHVAMYILSNHYVVHLKRIWILYVNYTSIKNVKFKNK